MLAYWLDTRDLFLKTAVARRIEHLIRTELLGLSVNRAQEGKPSDDALFAAMLDDPRVSHMLPRSLPAGGASDAGLSAILATYRGTRTASGEVSSAFVSLGVGALAFGKMTPGMMTLGPSVAAVLAHQTAVAGFPLACRLGARLRRPYAKGPMMTAQAVLCSVTRYIWMVVSSDRIRCPQNRHCPLILRLIPVPCCATTFCPSFG